MTDLPQKLRDSIRADHVEDDGGDCQGCWAELEWDLPWPCERILLLNALEAAEQELAGMQARVDAALVALNRSDWNSVLQARAAHVALDPSLLWLSWVS